MGLTCVNAFFLLLSSSQNLSCICYRLCSVSLAPAGCLCLPLVFGPRNSGLDVSKASQIPEKSGTIAPQQPLPPKSVVPSQHARPGWRDLSVLASAAGASCKGALPSVIEGVGKECPVSSFTEKLVLHYEREGGSLCSVLCCPRGS